MDQCVSVLTKVIAVRVKQRADDSFFLKQDSTIADSSTTDRVVSWEGDVGKLHVNKSYRLENVLVHVFSGDKYLSVYKESKIESVADIGKVDDTVAPECSGSKTFDGEIIGVLSLDVYKSCMHELFGKKRLPRVRKQEGAVYVRHTKHEP